MLSMNLKRKVAVLLTGVMVLGMTVTATAAPQTDENWDGKTGNGAFEGHVSRNIVDVDVPTVKDGLAPFNYILDAEGLIPETEAAAYDGLTNFDASSLDDNVYFLREDDKYYSESQPYTVSNNSSVSLNVTVKATLPEALENDVKFVSDPEDLPADQDPKTRPEKEVSSIYLALKVGTETKALEPGKTVEVSKVLNDGYDNYYVSYNGIGEDPKYSFKIKEDGDLTWADVDFSLVGKANKVADASGVTTPNLTLTWTFEDATEAAAAEEEAATEAAATAAANTFKTTYATILAKTTSTVAYADLSDINAALAAYDELSVAAKAKVTTEKALLDELKPAAEALAITDETGSLQYVSGASAWYIGKTTSAGISDSTFAIESVTLKKGDGEAVDVKAIATVEQYNGTYWIKVPYAAGAELGITYAAGTTYTSVAVVGTTRYTATKSY